MAVVYPKVLLISSADPLITSGRVALEYYKAFLQMNVDIDFLTLYPVKGYPNIRYVYKKKSNWRILFNKAIYYVTGRKKKYIRPGHVFFYSYDQLPPVPNYKILKSVDNNYDLVIIMFWQDMLSFRSIKGLYDKFHCQIHFGGVDYSQMSGGCHFTNECLRFKEGCGYCPGISSKRLKDFTYYNVRYRERIYDTVKPIVYGNTYMRENFYTQSYLLKNVRIEPSYDIYNMDEFRPLDKERLKEKFGISPNKSFVLFFGCQNMKEPRKGISYLVESLKLFWEKLTEIERDMVQIVVAGKQFNLIQDQIFFDKIDMGIVSMDTMIELYAMADAFLSPSINDAGPTMVNQALCCGTPVVAFEMGTALESIKGHFTGYCAKMKDSNDFAKGIEYIYRLLDKEKKEMRLCCRDYAEKHFSYQARVNCIIDIYNKYKDEYCDS